MSIFPSTYPWQNCLPSGLWAHHLERYHLLSYCSWGQFDLLQYGKRRALKLGVEWNDIHSALCSIWMSRLSLEIWCHLQMFMKGIGTEYLLPRFPFICWISRPSESMLLEFTRPQIIHHHFQLVLHGDILGTHSSVLSFIQCGQWGPSWRSAEGVHTSVECKVCALLEFMNDSVFAFISCCYL